ncbi:unnamed protein product [Brassicogethes aeneus]|uniref:Methenyltetrahydrofolate cyclohydrolase n=1 Tax=Brassicogethes aeneus TaxID=1431903 RepID=A0A9P0FMW8_BRAAE|nr:unnamed protein product [Brassicogethes aeneus]
MFVKIAVRFFSNSAKGLKRPNPTLIDGKKISLDIQKELRREIDDWMALGHRAPSLVAILVGNDPASEKYVKNKMLAARNVVQLPVPDNVNERNVCNAVDPKKDVDGFHVNNVGKLTLNMDTLIPATALGVVELIKRSQIETFGKNVGVVNLIKPDMVKPGACVIDVGITRIKTADGKDKLVGMLTLMV